VRTAAARQGRELFLATLEIHRRALQQPAPRLRDLQSTYDARYAVEVARRLPLAEITALGDATDLREEGLALARAGQLDRGAELVAAARRAFTGAALSAEAVLLAEWFQEPAEAYLQFRRGDPAGAEDSLLRAVAACVRLRAGFGYRVELRRVHLARNIVRVRNFAGRPVDALELAHHLVDHIEGVPGAWPWPQHTVAEPDDLTLDVRLLLLDQVLGDVARLLSPARPDARELLGVADARGWFRAGAGRPHIDRARIWLRARSMAVRGDWDEFLRLAGLFFAEPPGRFGVAWSELTGDLATVGAVRAPEEPVEPLVVTRTG
jgi:hypothetical protein